VTAAKQEPGFGLRQEVPGASQQGHAGKERVTFSPDDQRRTAAAGERAIANRAGHAMGKPQVLVNGRMGVEHQVGGRIGLLPEKWSSQK
jgi:hypothetical protein